MDDAAAEIVRDWLTRVSHDLRSARILAAAEDPPLDNDFVLHQLPQEMRPGG